MTGAEVTLSLFLGQLWAVKDDLGVKGIPHHDGCPNFCAPAALPAGLGNLTSSLFLPAHLRSSKACSRAMKREGRLGSRESISPILKVPTSCSHNSVSHFQLLLESTHTRAQRVHCRTLFVRERWEGMSQKGGSCENVRPAMGTLTGKLEGQADPSRHGKAPRALRRGERASQSGACTRRAPACTPKTKPPVSTGTDRRRGQERSARANTE